MNKDNIDKYFNKELSLLKFNERVLEQATDINNPLLKEKITTEKTV